jgi:hypothetical protein
MMDGSIHHTLVNMSVVASMVRITMARIAIPTALVAIARTRSIVPSIQLLRQKHVLVGQVTKVKHVPPNATVTWNVLRLAIKAQANVYVRTDMQAQRVSSVMRHIFQKDFHLRHLVTTTAILRLLAMDTEAATVRALAFALAHQVVLTATSARPMLIPRLQPNLVWHVRGSAWRLLLVVVTVRAILMGYVNVRQDGLGKLINLRWSHACRNVHVTRKAQSRAMMVVLAVAVVFVKLAGRGLHASNAPLTITQRDNAIRSAHEI